MSKIKLARERVKAGAWNDVLEGAWERYNAGGRESLQGAFAEEMADRAVQRYDGKIRAMFARGGVEIEEGQPLTAASIAAILSDKTGLQIDDIKPETIAGAIDRELSKKLSDVLKVPVSTVLDKERLLADVKEGVRLAIEDGRAADLLSRALVHSARVYATWKRRGIEAQEQARIRNAAAQKKYRRTHRLVWD